MEGSCHPCRLGVERRGILEMMEGEIEIQILLLGILHVVGR